MKAALVAVLFALMLLVTATPAEPAVAGKFLMPRDIAAAAHPYWRNYELTKAVAVALAESAGTVGAWHDNLASNGTVLSRDCGLYQINIPASSIGTYAESSLRTLSTDPAVYSMVVTKNVARAYSLYTQPWVNRPLRLWQPWVAYTTGWATFPQWWVWHQDASGRSTGPWIATGRYIQRAIAGQMNYHLVTLRDWPAKRALYYARRYAAHFGVHTGTLYVNAKGVIAWSAALKPSAPPADGVGPRPVPNNGV